jgi:transcriptional regulator with PAS, ATPase and Fis domain
LVVVLESDRPRAGGFVAPLSKPLVVGRGDERALRAGKLELPDAHLSKEHVVVSREGTRFRLVDRGSRNHTFVGESPITETVVEAGTVFRAGHTLFACLADVGPVLERARTGRPWPFATTNAAFALELANLEHIAQSPLPVLLLGETGTGKEVIARAIHARSGRPGPFVAVNCGALPKDLVEAQLFGHRRGAFSGATTDEDGFVRAAQGGTLFLDEIGDLPPSAQATLLRVLQEREVTPIGAFRPIPVDVRFVSATHHPLAARVEAGTFRADLFARLRTYSFAVPPLRERRFDVGNLIAEMAPSLTAFQPAAALALVEHDYPMNVRELRQALDVAGVLAQGGVVRPRHLTQILEAEAEGEADELEADDAALRAELVQRLAATDRNVSQVARDMGKARRQIQRWMKRFGI